MVTRKERVNPIDVERRHDYIIVKNDDKNQTVYLEPVDEMIEILKRIDETKFKNHMITPDCISKRLCEKHPELKTELLRPTGEYYARYHLVLKILDNERYIDYYKDGTIRKNKNLLDITPIKRGVDRWL